MKFINSLNVKVGTYLTSLIYDFEHKTLHFWDELQNIYLKL